RVRRRRLLILLFLVLMLRVLMLGLGLVRGSLRGGRSILVRRLLWLALLGHLRACMRLGTPSNRYRTRYVLAPAHLVRRWMILCSPLRMLVRVFPLSLRRSVVFLLM